MADKRIKGITIQIDGDTKKLNDALKDVNKQISQSNAELKDLRSALKLDPKNTELLAQKQEVLQKEIKATTDRLNTLKDAQKQLGDYNQLTDEQKENYRALSVEIAKTEAKLKDFKNELKETNSFDLNKLNNSLSGIRETTEKIVVSLAKVVTGIGGTLAALGVSSIKSYAEYEQLVGGVEAMFGGIEKGADKIAKIQNTAQKAWKDLTMSQNDYYKMFTSSYPLVKSSIEDENEAIEVTNRLLRLNSDLANTFGYDITTASTAVNWALKGSFNYIDNLNIGIKGTKEGFLEAARNCGYVVDSVDELSSSAILNVLEQYADKYGVLGRTAQEAGSTIQGSTKMLKSSWENLKLAISDDNADMGKAVNDFVDSTINASKNIVPRIKVAIEGIKKLFNSLVREVFPKLKREIPELKPLINIFEWFINNKNLLINTIKMIIAAFAVTKVIDFATQIKKTFDIITGFATGGTLGAVVTGITAVVSLFTLFASQSDKLSEANQKYKDEIDKTTESLDSYASSMERAYDQREEYLQTNLGELSYYDDLKDELKNIVDENGKVKKGYEDRAEFITTTLANAFDIEIDYTDGLITGYGDLEEKLGDVIEAKRAQILIESRESEYNEAKNKRNELEGTYEDILENNNKLHERREELLQKYADYIEISKDKLQEFIKEDGKIDNTKLDHYLISLKRDITSLNVYNKEWTDLNKEVSTNAELMGESDLALEKSREVWLENKKTIDDYELALGYMKDKNYEAVVNIYDNTKTYLGKTDEETYNNYQKQINMQEDYLRQLEENKKGYDQGFIDAEKKRTEQTIDNLKKEQQKYKTTAQENAQAYVNEFENKAGDIFQAGANFGQGLLNGINSKKGSIYTALTNMGLNMIDKIKKALKINSPSKATEEIGDYLIKGLSLGIKENENALLNQVDSLGNSIIDGFYDNTVTAMNGLGGLMNSSLNPTINPSIAYDLNYKIMANAMKEALQEVNVELDDREVGRFIDKTVSEEVFN